MSKRVTITNHDSELIKWLVDYFKENSTFIRFPAIQNVDELKVKFAQEESLEVKS